MLVRVGTTIALIMALVGSGFLFGQAAGDQEATAAARAGGSQAVVSQLKKLNRGIKSIDSRMEAVETDVHATALEVGYIGTDIESIRNDVAPIERITEQIGSINDDLSVRGLLYLIDKNTYELCKDATSTNLCDF